MQTLTESHPRARKAHDCSACHRTIGRGETYLRQVNVDGDMWVWKECAHCQACRPILLDGLLADEPLPPLLDTLHELAYESGAHAILDMHAQHGWRYLDGGVVNLDYVGQLVATATKGGGQ